ncbi:MAG: patatin-like phospholipase family protein [Ferruginibacter sp.]
MSDAPNRLGLSLSGGGYRAAAFHLGTLDKLQEMGVLQQTDVISTISGGSIIGAYYCLQKDNYSEFSQSLYKGLQQKNVITKVLLSGTFLQLVAFVLIFLGPAFYFLFTPYAWLFPVLLVICVILLFKFQFRIFPVSQRIETIYDQFFYHKKKLGDLPDHPVLVIGSTNIHTARPFTFSKKWMQDTKYQYRKVPILFKSTDFPIARAVMASSCVPFAFTPVKIAKQYFKNPADAAIVNPVLVDGGVYDNQGIHKIMQAGRYAASHVITSDAGGGSEINGTYNNAISLLIATVDVFMSRIKKVQMIQDVYENAETSKKQVAYFSLGWDIENCIPGFIKNLASKQITDSVITALQLKPEWINDPLKYEAELTEYLKSKTGYNDIEKPTAEERKIARTVGTNLTALSKQQVYCLMKQAACLTELQVKLYCPSLI